MTADLLLSDENVRKLALTLLHFLWQGALLGALAWGMLHILAPRSPQARYAIHCGLLLLLIAAPIATFVSLSKGAGLAPQANVQLPRQAAAFNPFIDEPTAAAVADDSSQQGCATVLRAWFARAQCWLVACWFIGSTIFGIRLALGAVGIWRILRTRQPLPPEVAVMVERLIQSMAFRMRPAVYASEQVSQAIAIGVIRPMVLLPAAWVLELQPIMLEAVLAHELAHLRRWDLPVNLLQRLVETLLFFHPVVWWCSRRLRIERELCCDERATQATGDRAGYAEALTFLAERQVSSWEPLLAAGIGGSRMVLLERIRNVLGVSRRAHGRFYGLSCAVVGAAAASLAWLLVVSATREESEVSTVGTLPSTTAGIDYEGAGSKARSTIAPPQKVEPRASWSPYARTAGTVVPSEKNKVILPNYTLEPPDILFIQSLRVVPKRPCRIQPSDILEIELERSSEGGKRSNTYVQAVSSLGRISLGAGVDKIPVQGLTEDEAAEAIGKLIADSRAIVKVTQSATLKSISGEHLIAPDGTVNLGSYGLVPLAGKTLEEARAAIEEHLSAVLEQPQVNLKVYAYNSKVYYVVTEGQGLGDTVARFPITGNETVLDALSQVNNLSGLSDKKIWIARPQFGGEGRDVVLPVDYQQIVQGKHTEANYQVLPGDRIFISDSPPAVPSKSQSNASDAAGYDTADAAAPPVLEYVRYFGNNKISPRTLAKETGLKKNDAFDVERISEAARKIRALYRAKGFHNTRVDIVEGTEPNSRGAVFLIYEDGKQSGVEFSFEGNNHEISSESHLLKVVQATKPGSEPASPEDNENRLTNFYRSFGFFKSRVKHQVSYDPAQDRLSITYRIEEGPRYSIRKVALDGNRAFPPETLMPTLKLGSGDPFDQSAMQADIAALKGFYGGHGYVFADAIADLRFDREPGVVDLVYHLKEGARGGAAAASAR